MSEEIASTLASGLPSYFPSSPDSDNHSLLKPIAVKVDQQNEDINTVDTATSVQELTSSRNDYTVPAGETVTIDEGDEMVFRDVTIQGDLVVNGDLIARTIDITSSGTLTVNGEVDTDDGYRDEAIARLEELAKLIDVSPRDGEGVEHYQARIIAEYSLVTGRGTIEDLINTTAEILSTNPSNIEFNEPSGGENGTAELTLPGAPLNEHELDDAELVSILDRLIPAGYRLEGLRTGTFTYITPAQYDISDFNTSRGYDGLDGNGDPKDNGGTYAGVI